MKRLRTKLDHWIARNPKKNGFSFASEEIA